MDTITGTENNDTINAIGDEFIAYGLGGNDSIHGEGFDQQLYGGAGNDVVDGTYAHDSTIDGGIGADTMYGGQGDIFYVDDSGDFVSTTVAYETTIYASASFSTTLVTHLILTGTADLDGSAAGIVDGNSGDNILTAADFGANTLNGGGGEDTIYGSAYGNANDALSGGDGDDILDGRGANDILDGGAGADTMKGGVGFDSFYVDNPGDYVVEVAGQDSVIGTDTIYSTIDIFRIFNNVENLTLLGDAVTGLGNDRNNAITGDLKDNILNGGEAGNDTISGDVGNDAIYGGIGNDMLAGGQGADSLSGGDGLDLLRGDEGADSMLGGAGDDQYFVDDAHDVVFEYNGEGHDIVNSSVDIGSLADNVEELALTGSAIRGYGNALDNVIGGNTEGNLLNGGSAGNDTIYAGSGNDSCYGGSGNDVIYADFDNDTVDGGTGADQMIGGFGNDVIFVDNVGDVVIENADQGTDTVSTKITYTLGANVENLVLFHGAASIAGTGNELDNLLRGNGGANVLTGAAGADIFLFKPDQDTGGIGADVVTDFVAGSASGHDVLQFATSLFSSFSGVIAASHQSGANVVIDAGAAGSVTLQNVQLSALVGEDFAFG